MQLLQDLFQIFKARALPEGHKTTRSDGSIWQKKNKKWVQVKAAPNKKKSKPAAKKKPVIKETPTKKKPGKQEETKAPKDIKVKVEERLQDKQAGNVYSVDVNERVRGSKKEIAAYKVIRDADLLSLDNATAERLVNKARVLPPVDWNEIKKKKQVPGGIAFLQKQLIDSIKNKPENTPEARKAYVELLPKLQEKILAIKNYTDYENLQNYFRQDFKKASWYDVFSLIQNVIKADIKPEEKIDKLNNLFPGLTYDSIKNARSDYGFFGVLSKKIKTMMKHGLIMDKDMTVNLSSNVLGKEFYNLLYTYTPAASHALYNSKLMNGISKEDIEDSVNSSVNSLKNVIVALKSGDYGSNYIFSDLRFNTSAGIRVGYGYSAKWLDIPDIEEQYIKKVKSAKELYFSNNTSDSEKENALNYARKALIEGMEKRIAGIKPENYMDKVVPDSWEWLKEKEAKPKKEKEAAGETKPKKRKIHDNPEITEYERLNGRVVKDTDVSPDMITKNYGYKSVQFGHYVKDAEAKHHIKRYLEASKDFEDALGINFTKLTQIGGLSLAIGARGRGKASAHYEPASKIINLTKSNGDGALSHEYGHFMDNILAKGGFLSKGAYSENGNVKDAFDGVMDSINKGDVHPKILVQPSKSHIYYPSIKLGFEQGGVKGALDFIEKYRDHRLYDKYLAYIAQLNGGAIEIENKNVSTTNFKSNSIKEGDYWSRPEELFARAFETYTHDKLEAKKMRNNYLVSSSQKGNGVYPQAEERARINAAMDNFFNTLRKEYSLEIVDKKEKRESKLENLSKKTDKKKVKKSAIYYIFKN